MHEDYVTQTVGSTENSLIGMKMERAWICIAEVGFCLEAPNGSNPVSMLVACT